MAGYSNPIQKNTPHSVGSMGQRIPSNGGLKTDPQSKHEQEAYEELNEN